VATLEPITALWCAAASRFGTTGVERIKKEFLNGFSKTLKDWQAKLTSNLFIAPVRERSIYRPKKGRCKELETDIETFIQSNQYLLPCYMFRLRPSHPWHPKFVAFVDRWSLLSELCYENWNLDSKVVVTIRRWS